MKIMLILSKNNLFEMKEVRYFFVPNASSTDELPSDEAQHAIRVLRLSEGDGIMLMDGCGTFYEAEVTMTASKRCFYKIVKEIPQRKTWRGNICLAIAPTKMMERMEWMAEKITEIGFDELVFLECKFSERRVVKTPRVEKIVVSAVKQSRKGWVPTINELTPFKAFISEPRKGRKYICHCYDEVARIPLFDELRKPVPTDCDDVTILVGPEGDFSIDEVRMAVDAGYVSVSLGESRLRTETAGLMAVTMAQLSRL